MTGRVLSFIELPTDELRVPIGRSERNLLAKDRSTPPEEKRQAGQSLKQRIHHVETQLNDVEQSIVQAAAALPNATHPAVPIGDESQAIVVAEVRPDACNFDFHPRTHVELGTIASYATITKEK